MSPNCETSLEPVSEFLDDLRRLHIGNRFTTVPRKEIGPGLLAAMLNDLNIDKKEFSCGTFIHAF